MSMKKLKLFRAAMGRVFIKYRHPMSMNLKFAFAGKFFALINILALLLPSLAVFPETAYAQTTSIRQEVNLVDGYFTVASSFPMTYVVAG